MSPFNPREPRTPTEPVSPANLVVGAVYYRVTFCDDYLRVPTLEPVIFIGRNLDPGDVDHVWFQDFQSYQRGARYDESGTDEAGSLYRCLEDQINQIYSFQGAIDVLLECWDRKRGQP